jgi:hypothetical protein
MTREVLIDPLCIQGKKTKNGKRAFWVEEIFQSRMTIAKCRILFIVSQEVHEAVR